MIAAAGTARAGVGPASGARISPHPVARRAFTAYVGMVVFLASWTMMFASLFFAYGLVRSRATTWPPFDQPALPLLLPGLNTLVALASSAALVLALRAFRGGDGRGGAGLVALAALLGAAFLALQCSVWVGLWEAGLQPDGGPYASVFYALTGFHGLHVLVGVLALAALAARAARGDYGPARHVPVQLWTMYWHFVGLIWIGLYLTVYIA